MFVVCVGGYGCMRVCVCACVCAGSCAVRVCVCGCACEFISVCSDGDAELQGVNVDFADIVVLQIYKRARRRHQGSLSVQAFCQEITVTLILELKWNKLGPDTILPLLLVQCACSKYSQQYRSLGF